MKTGKESEVREEGDRWMRGREKEMGETKNRKGWGAVGERGRKKINGGQVGRMTCTRLPALRKRKSRRRKERQRE